MLNLRRVQHQFRIEMMPLIDVIFLLLTFFIYAMVLMVRAELLPLDMPEFASGTPATPAEVITLSLDARGEFFLDREPIALADIVGRLRQAVADTPDLKIYLAADRRGETDRLPAFLELYDQLAFAGLDIILVGQPKDDAAPADTPP